MVGVIQSRDAAKIAIAARRFITPHDRFALRASRYTLRYLLKPVSEERFRELSEGKNSAQTIGGTELLPAWGRCWNSCSAKKSLPDRLLVQEEYEPSSSRLRKSLGSEKPIENYVLLHCGNKTTRCASTLDAWQNSLDPKLFVARRRGRRGARRRCCSISRRIARAVCSGGPLSAAPSEIPNNVRGPLIPTPLLPSVWVSSS